jgi:hypothetical protein
MGTTFLSNKLSAKDVYEISEAASREASQQGAASSVQDFATAGASGQHPQNYARDLLRKMVRQSSLQIFWWELPFQDPQTHERVLAPHPFLLPHEVVSSFVRSKGLADLLLDATQRAASKLLQEQCLKLGLNSMETVAIGMHGDGVPYTKKESLEILSLNFLAHPTGDRVPMTAVSKKFATTETWQCLLEVLVWSLQMLFIGKVSKYLPNGEPWEYSRAIGPDLPCRGLLLQVRGDWPFLRQLFHFPSWSSCRMCWKCTATTADGPRSYRNTSSGALWRQERVTSIAFLQELREADVALCPLLALPAFNLNCVVLDWLHVVDLGVGADALGNFFYSLIAAPGLLEGATKAARVFTLWQKLRAWYRLHRPASVLDQLTEEMIKRQGPTKKPKLKAKGAECRYLIGFGEDLSKAIASEHPGDARLITIKGLFHHLANLQRWVAGSNGEFQPQLAAEECRRFCALYESLQNASPFPLWHMKPKLHLMQELIEYQSFEHGNPRHFWCYRDESWCGYWAKASKRRGGANTSSTTARTFLLRYIAAETLEAEE